MNTLLNIVIVGIFLMAIGLIDLYVYQGIKVLLKGFSNRSKKLVCYSYWGFTIVILALLGASVFFPERITFGFGDFANVVITTYLPKILAGVFMLLDDFNRLLKWTRRKITSVPTPVQVPTTKKITRSEFLMKTAGLVAAVPVIGTAYGTVFGAYDYEVNRQKIFLSNLPTAFDGIRIAQISDIHSGSFFNSTAIKGGVELLLNEKPDMIFFTGDLINSRAREMHQYQDIFAKVKPL